MARETPIVRHEQGPLSFSDQPGYTLTCRGHHPKTRSLAEVSLRVECVEHIGWWQEGWIASLFRRAVTVVRLFTGRYVWRDDETGARVCMNLESGLGYLLTALEAD